jgi:exonuclease SbcD
MKFLHTADWHLGLEFYHHDRSREHIAFLSWLLNTLQEEAVNVLLISGDIFDLHNPAQSSVRLFYGFLRQVQEAMPHLQIIVTAGNHDSAPRLEAPVPLLFGDNLHIIGTIPRTGQGQPDYRRLAIPLKNKEGQTEAWCLAIPFLRAGDMATRGGENSAGYNSDLGQFYADAWTEISMLQKPGQAVIALGHLQVTEAQLVEGDSIEHRIPGELEGLPVSAFPADLDYVALGHVHRAQALGGREEVRYCGSPLPLSFAERDYEHQVVVFETAGGGVKGIRTIAVPVTVSLLSIPKVHQPLEKVLEEIAKLPNRRPADAPDEEPIIEVRVQLDGTETAVQYRIEEALEGKAVRLANINRKWAVLQLLDDPEARAENPEALHTLTPFTIFEKRFGELKESDYWNDLLTLLQEAVDKVSQPNTE